MQPKPSPKKRICLNMIVKNECQVIARSLCSVKPIIDSWVIVDTGSTDGTQELIKQCMKEIPGELYERSWVNFGHNREEALELAKKSEVAKADYILFLDADDYFSYADNFKLPELTRDFYDILSRTSSDRVYYLPQLIKSSLNWHWHGVLHEYVKAEDAKMGERLLGVENVYTSESSRAGDPARYKKDALILEEALKKEPHNARYMFYLAQSYFYSEELEKAIECYEKRIKMNGEEEEAFWALLQIAKLQERLKLDPKKVEQSYLKALFYRPVRMEPYFYLTHKLRQTRDFRNGYELATAALTALATHPPTDRHFVENWIYNYGMLYEYSACAYCVGRFEECKIGCDRLLALKNLPEEVRKFAAQMRLDAEDRRNDSRVIMPTAENNL